MQLPRRLISWCRDVGVRGWLRSEEILELRRHTVIDKVRGVSLLGTCENLHPVVIVHSCKQSRCQFAGHWVAPCRLSHPAFLVLLDVGAKMGNANLVILQLESGGVHRPVKWGRYRLALYFVMDFGRYSHDPLMPKM